MLLMILLAGVIFYFKWTKLDTVTYITQATGYISLIILTISLIIGPLNLLLKHKNPLSTYFRRDISITGGILALIHSVSGLFVHLRGKTYLYFLNKSDDGYSIRLDNFGLSNYTGLISALIIILLIITSNDYFLKKMKKGNWKNIQRLSYLMFILTLIHCYLYRIGKDNLNTLYFLYLPLLIIVLALQLTGIWIRRKKFEVN